MFVGDTWDTGWEQLEEANCSMCYAIFGTAEQAAKHMKRKHGVAIDGSEWNRVDKGFVVALRAELGEPEESEDDDDADGEEAESDAQFESVDEEGEEGGVELDGAAVENEYGSFALP